MSVGFGLLGSGFMAHTYAQSLARHVPDGHLVAIAMGSRAGGLAEEYGAALESSEAELLARDDIGAVIIATPHSTHLPLTRAAAAAGKHVYIEKPMAVTLADCDAMIDACRTAGVLLNVNNVTRHRAAPNAAKRLLDEGAIGDLRMVRVLSSVIAYLPDGNSWAHRPGEGGAWLDMGVHMFDALRWFTGSEVDTLYARIEDFTGEPHQRRTGMVQADLRSGAMAQILVSLEMPQPGLGSQSQWTLIGSHGIIESDSYGKVRIGDADGWRDVYEMPYFDLNADAYSPIRLEAFAAQTQAFALAVRAAQAGDPAADDPALHGADGRAAVELVEAAARSSATREAVRLPLDVA